jgi:hypothetical protein
LKFNQLAAEQESVCIIHTCFYNIRGFGAPGLRLHIKDLMIREHLNFMGLQETIRESFSLAEMLIIDPGGRYAWHSSSAKGRSGGLLLGVNKDAYEVKEWGDGSFFLSVTVVQLATRMTWVIFLVYGPIDHRRSPEFLSEISPIIAACPHPLVVGGDFNPIRGLEDKNNANIDWPRVQAFNDFLVNLAFREIRRVARYTWMNIQLNPVRCVVHRVFVSSK